MSKIIYISGSTQHNNVGVGPYGTEEERMQFLADRVKQYLLAGKADIVVHRNNGNMSLDETIHDSNNKHADAHVALHTNSGGGRGTECYYYYKTDTSTNLNGKRLATLVYNAVTPLTVAYDRGCKPDNSLYSNGLYETRETNAKSCLIEIMFHDNLADVTDYLGKVDTIAQAIAWAIYDYFGLVYSRVASEREEAIRKLRSASNYADSVWIKEFTVLEGKGLNIWGLVNQL
jgi:N-acetylmuramoyl-L-alanine amidase